MGENTLRIDTRRVHDGVLHGWTSLSLCSCQRIAGVRRDPQSGQPGDIAARPLTDAHGRQYVLGASGESQDASRAVSSVDGVYLLNAPPARGPPTLASSPSGPFLYVEQRRHSGLPAQLAAGTSHPAGRCTAFTGMYPDGLQWLALARGNVSLLAVSDHLGGNSDLSMSAPPVLPRSASHRLERTIIETPTTSRIQGRFTGQEPRTVDHGS